MYYDYIHIQQCQKKPRKYHKNLLVWTPTPPLRSRHLLHHAPLGLAALHHAKNLWITKHIRMCHCTVHSGSDVADDLVWVWRMSGSLLLNKNLLVGRYKTRRSINCVVRNGRRGVHNRMWYSNEPSHVPPRMSPRLVIRNPMIQHPTSIKAINTRITQIFKK